MSVALLPLLILLAIVSLISVGVYLLGRQVSERDIAWLAGSWPVGGDEARVYWAYLDRHNNGRLVGGLTGIVLGVILTIRWGDSWSLTVGVGTPLLGNLLAWWLGGAVLGTLAAEVYRLPRRRPIRQALLDSRPEPPLRGVVWVARTAGALTLVAAGLALTLLHDAVGLPGAIFTLVVVGLAESTRRAIADRPRPTTQPAVHVDVRLRWYAASSVAWLELAGATLGLATACNVWLASIPATSPWIAGGVAVWLAFIVVIIVAIFRSRLRPPRRWVAPVPQTVDYR